MGEKELFSYKQLLDGVMVPAHFAAFYDPSLGSFLSDNKLPFIIDPMTYACDTFNNVLMNDKDSYKKSYIKYFEKLKIEPNLMNINTIINMNDDFLEEFIDKILSFQYKVTLSENPRKKSLDRIRKYGNKSEIEKEKPAYLVPPYFYFNRVTDQKYELNKRIAIIAHKNNKYNLEICPCLCFSKDVISQITTIEKIVEDYSFSKKIIIWINNFDDRLVNYNNLLNLKNLIEKFSSQDIKILNLYGSYFSIILGYYGLDSFSSGICISHKKDINTKSTGGGLPFRYYEPNLKLEIMNYDALRLYSNYPELFICNCPICQPYSNKINECQTVPEREAFLESLFIDKKYPTFKKALMDWKNSRIHFMHVRKNEIEEQKLNEKSIIKTKLMNSYIKLSTIDISFIKSINSIEYLKRWHDVL
jgi:hypothetical protein